MRWKIRGTRLIVGDGRSHLLLTTARYDVIISEPSNPWMAGVAALFTREFFVAARSALEPDGMLLPMGAHLRHQRRTDLRSIVATFASVFPNGTMWLVGGGDLLLVGSAEPLERRLDDITTAWQRPGVAADYREVSVTEPFSLLSMFVGGPNELRNYAGDASLQTDDRMALEFSSPLALYGDAASGNASLLRQLADQSERPPAVADAFADAGPGQWHGRAAMLMKSDAHELAYDGYVKSLDLSPTDADVLGGFGLAAVVSHHEQDAVTRLTGWLAKHPRSVPLWIALSKLHAARGSFAEATEAAVRACRIEPLEPAALEQLASVHADEADTTKLDPVVGALLQHFPERAGTLFYSATAMFLHGQLQDALEQARRAIALDSNRAAAYNLLGAIHATLGQVHEARAAFKTALGRDPRDGATYTNLALLEFSAGERSLAEGLFAEALSLDPTSSAARQGLAQARAAGAR